METSLSVLQQELQHKIDSKTKPPGSLGMLEAVAIQIGVIQNTVSPRITNPHIVVFAADHGIAATGLVNPYPQAVTAQMVLNFVNDGAAINVFCRQHNIILKVVDSGVNYDFDGTIASKKFISLKMGYGTKDYLAQDAMTEKEVLSAVEKGRKIVYDIYHSGCNIIGFGEMGVGNTSSASLIMSAITGLSLTECVGRGTGVNDEQLIIKLKTLEQVYKKHELHLYANDPVHLLEKIGGFEIAMMVGAYLKAAELDMIIVTDGFISTAALLIALKINKRLLRHCIFAHTSGEQGHEKMLDYLRVKPLLHLGMRLGEGTGAALAIPLIQSAANFLNEMASFESAGVSEKS